jgi:metal-dependent amidase/aminoacylase/carboxypeptidase family protein
MGEYEGRSVGVMHACGHDTHMAVEVKFRAEPDEQNSSRSHDSRNYFQIEMRFV